MTNEATRPAENEILSVSDLRKIEKDPSLWVLNTSDLMGLRQQGDVNIEVVMPGGRSEVINIPKTWIPIDLSMYARRDVILESSSFLRAVQKTNLTPVSSEFAERMNKRQDVRDERHLLAIKANGIASSSSTNRPGLPTTNQPLAPMPQGDFLDAVSPRVITIMEADDAQMNPSVKLLSLKGLVNEIKGRDLRYILSKCGPEHEPISKWVNDMAKAIQQAGGEV